MPREKIQEMILEDMHSLRHDSSQNDIKNKEQVELKKVINASTISTVTNQKMKKRKS